MLGMLAVAWCGGCLATPRPRCDEIKATRGLDSGPWALLDELALDRPDDANVLAGIDDIRLVDLDGDGRSELLLNHRGARNRLYVSRAGYCGGYGPLEAVDLQGPLTSTGAWEEVDFLLADVDGEGGPELVWNVREPDRNLAYVGRLDPDQPDRASVRGGSRLDLGDPDWRKLAPTVLDVDHDGFDDVVWTSSDGSVCAAVAYGDASAQLLPRAPLQCFDVVDIAATMSDPPHELADHWSEYVQSHTLSGDVNADGQREIWFNFYRIVPNSLFAVQHAPEKDQLVPVAGSMRAEWLTWEAYEPLVGNVDGQHGDDAVWIAASWVSAAVYRTVSTAEGSFDALTERDMLMGGSEASVQLVHTNHDGRPDLLHLRPEGADWLVTLRPGSADGDFSLEEGDPLLEPTRLPIVAKQPRVHVSDVDGDGLDDLVFVEAREQTFRVQIALAAPGGTP